MISLGLYLSTAFPAMGDAKATAINRKVNAAMIVDRSHPKSTSRGLTKRLKKKYPKPENTTRLRKPDRTTNHP
jgi:hypothetical protein